MRILVKFLALVVLALGLGMGEAWLGALLDGTGGAGQEAVLQVIKRSEAVGYDWALPVREPQWDKVLGESETFVSNRIDYTRRHPDLSRIPAGAGNAALPSGVDWSKLYPDNGQLRISGRQHSSAITAIDVDGAPRRPST